MNNKAKRLHIFFGQNHTKTDTVLFDDYGWGAWYVLIMVKGFLCVFYVQTYHPTLKIFEN